MVVLRPFDKGVFLNEVEGLYHDLEEDTLRLMLPGHTDLLVRECHEVHMPVRDHDLSGVHGVDSLACRYRRRGAGATPFFYSEVGLVFVYSFVFLVRTSSLGGRTIIRAKVAEDQAPGWHLGEVSLRFSMSFGISNVGVHHVV